MDAEFDKKFSSVNQYYSVVPSILDRGVYKSRYLRESVVDLYVSDRK